MAQRKLVSAEVSIEVWRAIRVEAAKRDMKIWQLLNEILEQWLADHPQ